MTQAQQIRMAATYAADLIKARIRLPRIAILRAAEMYQVDRHLVAKEMNRRAQIVRHERTMLAQAEQLSLTFQATSQQGEIFNEYQAEVQAAGQRNS